MKQKITLLIFGFLLTLGISSCVKDSAPELGTRGNTIIKFNEGPRKDFYYSPFPAGTKSETITFTRDVNSNAALNKPSEVIILEDPTLIPAGYTELPAANFTYTVDPGVIITSGKITAIRFAAGEFSKKIKITLIGSAWTTLTTKYAKAYKVTDAGGNQIATANGTMIGTFAIKNQWDGVYSVAGTLVDVYLGPSVSHINDILGSDGPMQYQLITSGLTKCNSYDAYFWPNAYIVPWRSGTGASGYGSFSPVFEFDAATNKVVAVTNYYGQPASNGRYAQINPAGFNDVDPVTKTIRISYFMYQPSLVPVGPRTTITEVWTYLGPRP